MKFYCWGGGTHLRMTVHGAKELFTERDSSSEIVASDGVRMQEPQGSGEGIA